LDNGYDGRLTIHLGINHTAGPGLLLTHKVAITTLPVEDDFDDNAITWVESLNNPGPNLRVDKQNFDWWGDSTINYELRIYNLGSDTLENFWITDTYPVSTTFEGDWNVNHGGWYTLTVDEANHQLIFWGERLDPGNTASIGFRVNLDKSISGVKGLAFTNRVAAPITGDVFPADNFDEVTALTGPDLYVDKSLAGGDLLPGEIITYKLKFGNAHHGNAKWWSLQGTAWLTDTLPDKAEFLSAKLLYCGSEIWCDFTPPSVNGNNLLWQLWPIGWGGHNEILVTARISDSVTGLDTLLNQVEIASDQPENDLEADYTNNHASLSLPITLPYFETGKSYTSSKVAGMPITYNLTVSNTGSVAGTNVALWDWIPSWMTYGGGGSYDAGLITWTLPTIGPGSQASAWFTGTLQCTEGAIVNNQYYFVESSDQGVTSTYGAPVSFATLAPTIDVTAQASKTTIRPGQTVYFTATATTDGTPLTYTWKIGNTVIGTGAHINHGFSNPGSYDVTVTVTDACGYNNTFTITIIIQKYKIYLPAIRKP
jgi:uncharacterized repeat protein (TIGR01451 family)